MIEIYFHLDSIMKAYFPDKEMDETNTTFYIFSIDLVSGQQQLLWIVTRLKNGSSKHHISQYCSTKLSRIREQGGEREQNTSQGYFIDTPENKFYDNNGSK